MKTLRRHAADVLLIAVACGLQTLPLPAGWIERDYANGIYAALARTLVPLSNALPFALGDALFGAIVLSFVVYWPAAWRRSRAPRALRALAIGSRSLAALALIAIWFDAAWALNYRRIPVEGRIAFDPSRVSPANVRAFGAQIVQALNATAPLAHARNESEAQMEGALARAFGPVTRRLGDGYDVVVSRPKRTIFNTWFAMAGIGGMWDPFAYETLLNADFLPFERPFALAHEWGHVAGFGDESDANLIAALTTLRSDDPFVRYSGLFWAYGFLPEQDRQTYPLSPLVTSDLSAARRRFLAHYNPGLFALQWFAYDKYLRANRVRAGVVSYSLFVRILVGTPLDGAGLPRLPGVSARTPAGARDGARFR